MCVVDNRYRIHVENLMNTIAHCNQVSLMCTFQLRKLLMGHCQLNEQVLHKVTLEIWDTLQNLQMWMDNENGKKAANLMRILQVGYPL